MLAALTIKLCMTSAPDQHRDYHNTRRRVQARVNLLQFNSVLFVVLTATCCLERIQRNSSLNPQPDIMGGTVCSRLVG